MSFEEELITTKVFEVVLEAAKFQTHLRRFCEALYLHDADLVRVRMDELREAMVEVIENE